MENLSFQQINSLIGAAIDAEENEKLKLRWIINYEPAGMSWDEFMKNIKIKRHVETPEETHAKIAAIFDDTSIKWVRKDLSEVTGAHGNI